jgi:hypothetical protein
MILTHIKTPVDLITIQVERGWVEVNLNLYKWYLEFRELENMGVLEGGRHPSNIDLFCLHQVYLTHIKASLGTHFASVNRMTKKKDTRNPNYPRGSSTRWKLYCRQNLGYTMSAPEIDAATGASRNYWAFTRPNSLLPRVWQVDPVQTAGGRLARRLHVIDKNCVSLMETYVAYREITIELCDMGL